MHDIRMIRENPDGFDAMLARRGLSAMSSEILAIDGARRTKITAAEEAQAARNAASKDVGKAKAAGDEAEFERLRTLVADKKDEIARLEEEAREEDARLNDILLGIPNLPLDDVPEGADETANVELRRWGSPRNFAFDPKEHWELGEAMGAMDFETAARLSGSRFVVLSGALIRLHRALAQFMLDTHVDENGLTEVWTPVLVREEAMVGTGQLPKFAEDSYQTTNGWWLIPTAEVTLTNIPAGHIMEEDYLPRRYTAWTQCFRSEAGSAGKDTRGMLRQHQFEKVEMVSITRPRGQRRRTRAHDALCRGHPGEAGAALPHRRPLHRRHGVRRAPDPRCRGLAARPERLSRDQLLLDLRRFPGAAHERALPAQGPEAAGVRPHPERIGPGRWPDPDRGDGELPAGRRFDRDSRGDPVLHARCNADLGRRNAGLMRQNR